MAYITVSTSGLLSSLLTVFMGGLVLAFPKFLRILVGLYFILVGILGLLAFVKF